MSATVDLEDVRSYRASIGSRGLQVGVARGVAWTLYMEDVWAWLGVLEDGVHGKLSVTGGCGLGCGLDLEDV